MDKKKEILQAINENKEKLTGLCSWIREHPEISLEEKETSKNICEFLRAEGFTVTEHLEGMETAFKATKKNGEGLRLAYVAEYDALPGNGHACGHHMIATMSIGAAMGLSSLKDWTGEISIIGTPAEETGHGKPYLVEHGVFEGYDAAMMIHPHAGTMLCPLMIAIGGIDFSFTGTPAHAGAAPDKGVNALDAVVLFYNNINALRQQLRDGTRIHGIILEAGSAANIIPDKGKVRLEFRAKEQDYFNEVVEKVINCAKAAALATGCQLSYEHFEPTCQGMNHNQTIVQVFKKHMEDMGIFENTEAMSGSTDMGNVSHVVPSIHPMLGISDGNEEIHTPEFLQATTKPMAMERLLIGAQLLALTGLSLIEDPEIVKEAKKELEKQSS